MWLRKCDEEVSRGETKGDVRGRVLAPGGVQKGGVLGRVLAPVRRRAKMCLFAFRRHPAG